MTKMEKNLGVDKKEYLGLVGKVGGIIAGIGLLVGGFAAMDYAINLNRVVRNLNGAKANIEHVNKDKIPDLVITVKDGQNFILYGQEDGTYKGLDRILEDKREEKEHEYKKLHELYKPREEQK